MKNKRTRILVYCIIGFVGLAIFSFGSWLSIKNEEKATVTTVVTSTAEETTAAPVDENVAALPAVPTGTDKEKAAAYIAVCQKGLNENAQAVIAELGYYNYFGDDNQHLLDIRDSWSLSDLNTMYYPVLYRTSENEVTIWYVDKFGNLNTGYIGDHLEIQVSGRDSKDYDYMMCAPDQEIIYFVETGVIEIWSFGKMLSSYKVPANAVYCGHGFFEGHIFRSGSDVYAFQRYGKDDSTPVIIAHGVKQVIAADYRHGSDPWSQPLFIMITGEVMAYVGWEDNYSVDSPKQLEEIRQDGGNYKLYLPAE